MYFKTKAGETTLLFADIPSNPPTDEEMLKAAIIEPKVPLESLQEDETKTWFKVKALLGLADKEGWVKAVEVEPAEPPEPEPLDPWSFVKNCTLAARVVNKENVTTGHGINRDFMIAYALVQTGTETNAIPQNVTSGEGPAQRVGPFALTAAEWKRFVDSKANKVGYIESDIRNPVFQCYGFARLVLEATKALSQKFTIDDPTKSSGPWVPSSIDLFVYLTCGEAAAFEFIAKMAAGGAGKAIPVIRAKAGDAADAILKRYGRFFGTEADNRAIKDVDEKIAAELDTALKRSFTLVREHTPEDIIYFVSGTLPWMVKAREERTKEVKETKAPPNPEVLKYFKSTGYKTQKEDPWCGAFVAWCLEHSGSEKAAKSVNKATAARAADWKTWGDVEVPIGAHEKGAVPVGAVVVLKPRKKTSDTSGHVAFFVEQDAQTISLLGGNQSDSVKISKFSRSQVVAIRMLKGFDAEPVAASGPGTLDPNFGEGTLGPFTKEDWARYIDVLGKRESANNYAAVNQIGYCGRWQFGAGALIDGGFVKAGATTRRLAEDRWWTGKNGIQSRTNWLANKDSCQDTEMIAYTRRNYRSLQNVPASKKVIEQANKAQLAGLLATSHLLGPGGARKMLKGQDGQDANKVTGRSYYKMLATAFGGSPNPPQV